MRIVFIDSVFVESNRFLNELGAINNELFLSSVILPSNAAWNEFMAKFSRIIVLLINWTRIRL